MNCSVVEVLTTVSQQKRPPFGRIGANEADLEEFSITDLIHQALNLCLLQAEHQP